jgi:hypothetical protein
MNIDKIGQNRYKIQNLKFGLKQPKIDRFCRKLDDFPGLLNDFLKTKLVFLNVYSHHAINHYVR